MVLTDQSNNSCVVSGDLELLTETGCLSLQYIDKGLTVEDGAKILTSNLSSEYLPDILIGYARDVAVDSDNLQQSGYLVPAVDFDDLREVMVILDLKETGEGLEEDGASRPLLRRPEKQPRMRRLRARPVRPEKESKDR